MTISNRRTYTALPFAEYLKLPGIGFSGLRNPGGMAPTAKMRFGSLVDDYLFTPAQYSGEQVELVKPVALELRHVLGAALQYGKPQLSVTADFTWQDFTLPFRGRLDLFLPGLVVDLKVSELDPRKAVEHFLYHHQLSGYALAMGVSKAILCSINPKTKKVTLLPLPIRTDWWEHQIIQYGTANIAQ